MESKFFKEALFKGKTANAIKLGTVLTLGRFWVRISGCHTIYRGQDGDIDDDNVQGVMNVNAGQVSIVAQNLPANTIWHYIRRQVSGCGLESIDSPACVVFINSSGEMIGNTPNPPLNLTIEKLSNARLKLRWRYTPIAEEITPTGFKIYRIIGFNFVLWGTVSYGLGGIGEFDWTSEPFKHGDLYRFCVRSYRSDGGETQNTNFVAATADSAGPDAITNLRAAWEQI